LVYPLQVWSHSILVDTNGKPVPENMGIDIESSLLTCLGVEKHVFQDLSLPYWFFPRTRTRKSTQPYTHTHVYTNDAQLKAIAYFGTW